MPGGPPPDTHTSVSPTLSPLPSAASSTGTPPPASSAPVSASRTQIADDHSFFHEAEPAPGTSPTSTIQGTETSLDGARARPRRARLARLAAIIACVVALVPIAVVGSRKLGAADADAIEATLDEARDAMRRHAWDTPEGHNFKQITEAGLARFPDSTRIQDLRRDAAERLVADALGRKYAGDTAEALHFVRLALEWNPGLTTAQHLAAELERPQAIEVAPILSAAPSADKGGKGPRKGGPRSPEPRNVPAPPASAAPGGAQLPPSPTPPPPAPPPSSTGPWL